jgi:hypothetical protein
MQAAMTTSYDDVGSGWPRREKEISMPTDSDVRQNVTPSTVLGGLLIAFGALFLFTQLLRTDAGRYAWPFFVILPAVALLVIGLVSRTGGGARLAVVGSVTTTLGLLLLYQNTTGHWASWAYAWALLPTAVGLGLILQGTVGREPRRVRYGRRITSIGVVLFAVGFAFFELVLELSGFRLPLTASFWPLILIGFGLLLLFHPAPPRAD